MIHSQNDPFDAKNDCRAFKRIKSLYIALEIYMNCKY